MNKPTLKRTVTIDEPVYPRKLSRKNSRVARVARPIGIIAEKKEKSTLWAPNIYNLTTSTQTFVQTVNLVANGNGIGERVGRKTRHYGITVNAYFAPKSSMLSSDFGFMCYILDRQPNGAIAPFTDMFDTSAMANNDGICPRLTSSYQERFKVLKRWDWKCAPYNNGSVCHIHDYIDLSRMRGPDATVNYGGTTSSSGDCNSGVIYLVIAQGNIQQTVSNAMDCRVHTKYRYTDV